MYRIALSLTVASMVAAAPVSAQDATAPQPAADKPAKEKKICKTDVGTGSIMPKRTCRTKAEWDALTEQSQGNLQRTQNRDAAMGMVGGSRGN